MPGTWRVPVSLQSHSRAPPGKTLASLKGEKPSTSMRPQARCTMRGDFGSAWPISASENKKGKPGHCDRSFPRYALSLMFFARIDRKESLRVGQFSGKVAASKNKLRMLPKYHVRSGSALCSNIAEAGAVDVSRASPFHAMVPPKFASRPVSRNRKRKKRNGG